MAYPPHGSAQKERIRFALCCVAVLLRRFLCQGTEGCPAIWNGKGGGSVPISPEEDAQIETFVKLSGLTKQDYITRRLTGKDVVVQGNPRVYKALRGQLAAVLDELRRIEAGGSVNDELLDVIEMIAAIMDGMKEENAYGE